LASYNNEYTDMVEPTYILSGIKRDELAFSCVTRSFSGGAKGNAAAFD